MFFGTSGAKVSSNIAVPMVKASAPASATVLIRSGEEILPATIR
jgi:hypothetical protein